MSLIRLNCCGRFELARVDAVFGQEMVEITAGYTCELRRDRDIASTFGQQPRDRLPLELSNDPILARDEALFRRHPDTERGRSLYVQGEMDRLDHAFGEYDGALDGVLELAQIAGPRITLEEVQRFGG